MIRLVKQPEPHILLTHGIVWRDEYLAALEAGGTVPDAIKYRYRHPEVRAALVIETSGKCAYCESRIAPVAPENVEHILPKSECPDLIVTWTNLTIACPVCNTLKGDYYSQAAPLLNPYIDDPEEHLIHVCPMILPRLGSLIGEMTQLRLRLSRSGLVERKRVRIEALQHLLSRWSYETNPQLKILLEAAVRQEGSADAEYSATVNHYRSRLSTAVKAKTFLRAVLAF